MSAPPRLLAPFVRTRTRLSLTIGLVLAALTAALLPWWHHDTPPTAHGGTSADAKSVSAGPHDEAGAVAEALRTGQQVLIDTLTSATELTWALPDGQLRTRIHALPQRAKNAKGEWAPIDNKLTRANGSPGALGVVPANPALPVRFSSGSGSGVRANRSLTRAPQPGETVLAEVDLGGHTIAYTWPGALPEPVLDGPRALYSEVLPGVDLLLVAREEGGFGQVLIVKNREAARNGALDTVSYGLRSATATFRHDAEASRIQVLDQAAQEVGTIPTPFAWDSNGRDPELPEGQPAPRTATATPADVLKLSGLTGIEPGARSAPIPLRLDGEGTGAAQLRLQASETKLLTDENVKFPVFIDPPLNSGWQAWTTAYRRYPSSSFWNGTNFSSGTSDARVGYESDTGGLGRSFWRMGFSSSYKGATFTRATFKVLNNHSWSCTTREFQFWLTGSISSGTTWNAQPSWSTKLDQQSFAHGWSSSSCPDDYEAFDVKAAAQKGADSGWSNITFGMRATSEGDTQTWRKFRATSAVLEGDYNRPPSEPTNGTTSPGGDCVVGSPGRTVGRTNLTLKAKAVDADNNLKGLRFRFWEAGTTAPAGTLATNLSSGYASTVIVPSATMLVDKKTYYWDVRAEDTVGATSTFFPAGTTTPCAVTIDGSGPPTPTVDEDTTPFKRATNDGATWASVKFGGTGAMTFSSAGAAKFSYAFDGTNIKYVNAVNGSATVPDLRPPHAGPNWLQLYAYDALGNPSVRGDYPTYVQPKDNADGPHDVGGDGLPDILGVTSAGNLASYSGGEGGDLYGSLVGSYSAGGKLNPAGHWYDPATGKAALIAHYGDVYPGDGTTDLFARTPDNQFWLYPGDGYGSFNVDERIAIRLPSNTPAPATWTQLKAVGDVTGDKLPDLFLRAGPAFWVLSGYTGATFRTATLMNVDAWERRDIVNVADINQDATPDLLWRNLDNGVMYVRHGKPGAVAGSVDLNSLTLAANSLNGDVEYGTAWTEANVSTAIGIPDVNGDSIPDIWARSGVDGQMRVYYPSQTNTNAPAKNVLTVDWRSMRSMS